MRVIERHRGDPRRRPSARRREEAAGCGSAGPWAAVIQCSAFVRKELAEIVRQPGLILLLIVGPVRAADDVRVRLPQRRARAADDLRRPARLVLRAGRRRLPGAARAVRRAAGLHDRRGGGAGAASRTASSTSSSCSRRTPSAPCWRANGRRSRCGTTRSTRSRRRPSTIAAQLAVQEINATVLAAVVSRVAGGAAPGRRRHRRARRRPAVRSATRPARPTRRASSSTPARSAPRRPSCARSSPSPTSCCRRLGAADDGTRADVLDRLDEVAASAGRIEAGTSNETAADAEAIAANVGRASPTPCRRSRRSTRTSSFGRS